MSAPAVKPALPAAGAQAPKVGSGAPPAAPNNPPPPVAGGPKVLPTTGSPNRPLAPPNVNHAAVGSMPLSLVQEHKGGGGLNQQPPSVTRTPEKPKEHPLASSMGVKPTSNGVEGSPNRPASTTTTTTTQPTLEAKKPEESTVATAVMNHSAEIAATPPQPQPALHSPLLTGTQSSPAKPQPAAVSTGATNHSTLLSVTNKVEGTAVEAKPPVTAGATQSAEPPPPQTTTLGSTTTTTTPITTSIQQPQPQPTTHTPQPPAVTPQLQQSPPQQLQPPTQPQPQPQPQPQQQQVQQPPQQQSQQQQQPKPAPAPTPAPQPQQTTPPPAPQQPAAAPQMQQQPQQTPPAAPAQPQTVTPSSQEAPAKPTISATEPTKTRTEAPKPEFKVATPPRNSKRKREVKPPAEVSAASEKTPTSSEQDDRKSSKRVRHQTQPYQSPLPELTYIAKLKTLMKSPDDKLIVFYKNEFLAVRNAEGSFYICQAMQNIYKSSPRIRIRWLSQEKKDNKSTDVYIPDFYDATDFDCILTNLELKRLDKNKFQLPEEERERTQSILKRALDVEKGVSEKPPVTEEHPDGLDLSLFRDESQLKKRRSLKRAAPRKKGKENASGTEDGYEGLTGDDESEEEEEEEEEEVKKKKPKQTKKVEKPKEKAKTKEKSVEKKAERVSERGRDRSLAAKRRSESTAAAAAATAAAAAAVAAKNAAVKQTVAKHAVAKTAEKKTKVATKTPKKPEPVVESSIPTRSTKTRSVKVTSQPKSSPVTRTKERERRGAPPAKGRKKPGKKA